MEVYLLTNKINGKRYVGQTKYGMAQRWKSHVRQTRRPKVKIYVDRAILKYGPENFEQRVLWRGNAICEMNAWESHYIWAFDTKGPRGYNLVDGGRGSPNPTPESRERSAKATKQTWRDPAIRIKRIEGMAQLDSKQLRSEKSLLAWRDPEIRKRRIEGMLKARSDPAKHSERSEATRRGWETRRRLKFR
jgi:group I intron endonuclease